jgi:predicted GIY-YIG superfamily endonuclease
VLYLTPGYDRDPLLKRLGRHKTGKSCLYLNRLEDVDLEVLRELVEKSVAAAAKQEA